MTNPEKLPWTYYDGILYDCDGGIVRGNAARQMLAAASHLAHQINPESPVAALDGLCEVVRKLQDATTFSQLKRTRDLLDKLSEPPWQAPEFKPGAVYRSRSGSVYFAINGDSADYQKRLVGIASMVSELWPMPEALKKIRLEKIADSLAEYFANKPEPEQLAQYGKAVTVKDHEISQPPIGLPKDIATYDIVRHLYDHFDPPALSTLRSLTLSEDWDRVVAKWLADNKPEFRK
jgi:hypothetical protein